MDKPKQEPKPEPKPETKKADPLSDKFNSEDSPNIFCKTCGQGWVIDDPTAPANLTFLLDHAAQHAN